MATYVPAAFYATGVVSVTSTATYYSLPASTTAIIRTILGQSSAASHTFTVDLGTADAAQQRIIDAYALTASVPAIFNGWWVNGTSSISAIGLKSDTATANIVIGSVSGYTYT